MTSGSHSVPALDLSASRDAQARWARESLSTRLGVIRRFRELLASRCTEFAAAVDRDHAEALVSEVLPLADACRYLERNAAGILKPRRLPRRDRPLWLTGVDVEIRRDPIGVVLVIGPFNYPLFLPGVQALQSLAAANAVVLKPGRGGLKVMQSMARCLIEAGLDARLFRVLGEDPEQARQAIQFGVDKVLLTGSRDTGLAVLNQLAEHGTPSVMELSGFDPVFVRPGADLTLAARAIRFGLALNNGQTCIAPRTVYAPPAIAPQLQSELDKLRVSIPVIAADDEQALAHAASSGYALGASVFGKPGEAERFSHHIDAGVVVINDMIVPTADPRVPFGGRRRSGFGVTRGPEGLLEVTALKAIVVRRGRWLPHLEPKHPSDSRLFSSLIQWRHGPSFAGRMRALGTMLHAAWQRKQSI